MVVNPLGAVPILDGETPRTVTAICNVAVTGGQLVYFSGANNVVSSGAYSFDATDIAIAGVASGAQFNGIVLTPGNTASGTSNYVTVATAGTFILPADGSVFAGYPVMCLGTDSVQVLGSQIVPAAATDGGMAAKKIGRALTNAASGTSNFAIVTLTP
jgi:hypothetical protein